MQKLTKKITNNKIAIKIGEAVILKIPIFKPVSQIHKPSLLERRRRHVHLDSHGANNKEICGAGAVFKFTDDTLTQRHVQFWNFPSFLLLT